MKKNNVKNNTIKAALILGAALAFAAPAATMLQPQEVKAADFGFGFSFNSSSTESNTETCHGISKTTTTSTVNGVTEETVEYTDENGNVLDEEIGEKAFAAAQDGIDNPLEYVTGAEKVTDASFFFDNETDTDFTELYFMGEDNEGWGENWFSEEVYMAANTTVSYRDTVDYKPAKDFKIGIVSADGEGISFHDLSLANCEDPSNITFTFTEKDGTWTINIK